MEFLHVFKQNLYHEELLIIMLSFEILTYAAIKFDYIFKQTSLFTYPTKQDCFHIQPNKFASISNQTSLLTHPTKQVCLLSNQKVCLHIQPNKFAYCPTKKVCLLSNQTSLLTYPTKQICLHIQQSKFAYLNLLSLQRKLWKLQFLI